MRQNTFRKNDKMGSIQMLCIHPVKFNHGKHTAACGQCTNCRINHKLRWMGRMALEAKYGHPGIPGAFITLTYSDDHLSSTSLVRSDLTRFIKNLKRQVGPQERYFAVGEYGSQTLRPHFHVLHFGGSADSSWQLLYKKLWPKGNIMVGNAQAASHNYVAGYVTKKLDQAHHLQIEDRGYVPEFFSASLKPTLGYSGLKAIAAMLNTDQGSKALATKGFPRGFNLGGRYYPFMRRDRLMLAKLAGYEKTMEDFLEDITLRSEFYVEEMEVYRQAEANHWPAWRLTLELEKLEEDQHGKEIEKEIERARAKAIKWRRRQKAISPKGLDGKTLH